VVAIPSDFTWPVELCARRLLDNAPMESFFASLKKEHGHQACFRTHEEAKAAVLDDSEIFYNPQRLNAAIGYRTLVQARGHGRGQHRHGSVML
jgi:transposase InsO family protein